MIIQVDIPDELVEKTLVRFTALSEHNRGIERTVTSRASAREAGDRAIVYEAILDGIHKRQEEDNGHNGGDRARSKTVSRGRRGAR
ncbi:MAG: hypothetical protein AB1805_07450 [Nitrospirota bacterium]